MDATIRKEWRELLLTDDIWEPASKPGNPGEAGGYFMKCQKNPRLVAWMKPKRLDPNKKANHAAKEKIAFDLSVELDISVPPVLLFRRSNPPADENVLACLSLVCYPSQYAWGEVFSISASHGGLLPHSQCQVEQELAAVSGIVALDVWLQNTDRHSPNNALLGYDPSKIDGGFGEFLFIDFSNSLKWKDCNDFRKLTIPALFANALSWDVVNEMVTRIESIPDEVIQSIVGRVPADFLSDDSRIKIAEDLCSRKTTLRTNMAHWYPGTGGAPFK